MIRFEGVRQFSMAQEAVQGKLSDAAFLVSCLQTVEKLVESSIDRAVWKLKTGFSFLSTTLDITLTVTGREESRTTFDAHSKGVGASSLVKAALTFSPSDSGTAVHYTAEVVERSGFLKIVSAGLIQAAAKSVIEDTWKSIEAKLTSA